MWVDKFYLNSSVRNFIKIHLAALTHKWARKILKKNKSILILCSLVVGALEGGEVLCIFYIVVPTGAETCRSPLSSVLAWHLVLITPWLSTCPLAILRFKETTTCKIYGKLYQISWAMRGLFWHYLAFQKAEMPVVNFLLKIQQTLRNG
jgi:hypothetical protein